MKGEGVMSYQRLLHHGQVDQEWILTNGTGSYAMGRTDRLPTRRYHGLWIQALHPPRNRQLILGPMAIDLTLGTTTYPLWQAHWASGTRGSGPTGLMNFHEEFGIPTYRWDIGTTSLTESIYLIPGYQGVILAYHYQGPVRAQLKLTPLFRGQDHHQLGAKEPDLVHYASDRVTMTWDAHAWLMRTSHGTFMANLQTYRQFLSLPRIPGSGRPLKPGIL